MDAVLVTGAAGFIGYHVAERLLARGQRVVGFDALTPYYDPALKQARLDRLARHPNFAFVKGDLADRGAVEALFATTPFATVVHLAAQAGVRYAVTDPHAYASSNLVGFLHVLEGCRAGGTRHLVYASSSSVYGASPTPFSEHRPADHPLSLYAATKRANELMAHSYAHLFGLPCTGLRFFTVYGPWGRPDMALFKFVRAITRGEPIELYNHGEMARDLTYVDDVADAVVALIPHPPRPAPAWQGDAASAAVPWRVFNVGNTTPVPLRALVASVERALGRTADIRLAPMMAGDVPSTHADVADLAAVIGFQPSTPLDVGVDRFVAWYRAWEAGHADDDLPGGPDKA